MTHKNMRAVQKASGTFHDLWQDLRGNRVNPFIHSTHWHKKDQGWRRAGGAGMCHRKPTRNSGLVMKVVSHNYNHLSPRSDLGGQYLVHIVKKVVIWPSPLHNTLTCPCRASLSGVEATAVGTYASVQSVRLAVIESTPCWVPETEGEGTGRNGSGRCADEAAAKTLEPGTAAGTLTLGAGGVGAATLRSSKSAPDSRVTVRAQPGPEGSPGWQ